MATPNRSLTCTREWICGRITEVRRYCMDANEFRKVGHEVVDWLLVNVITTTHKSGSRKRCGQLSRTRLQGPCRHSYRHVNRCRKFPVTFFAERGSIKSWYVAVVLGAGGALGLTRLMASLLYNIGAR